MLIGMVAHSPDLAGAERMLVNLACGLADRGMASSLLLYSGHGPIESLTVPRRCQFRRINATIPWYINPGFENADDYLKEILPAAREIAAIFRSKGVDLVIVNTLTNTAGLLAAAILNLPVVTWVHGILDDHILDGTGSVIKPLFDDLLLRSAVAVVSPSEWTSQHFRKHSDLKVTTIPNAFELPDSIQPISPGTPRFVCLNTFNNHKGHDVSLQATYLLRQNGYKFDFYWYGAGTVKDRFARVVKQLDLGDTVHFKGRTTDVSFVYDGSTALVTAAQIESFGMTLIEAMGHGRPIVASDTSGHREIVTPEVGFLCPVNDPSAFAARMAWIIDHPEQASEMGRAAREIAAEKFSMDRLCRDFEQLFQNVLEAERNTASSEFRNRYRNTRSYLQHVA